MKRRETRTKTYTVKIDKCDFCNTEVEDQKSMTGISPIMECVVCGKDCCRDHRTMYNTGCDQTYCGAVYEGLDSVCCDCDEEFKEAYESVCCEDIEYACNSHGECFIMGDSLTERALKYIKNAESK